MEDEQQDKALANALTSLSLTTKLDSALLAHLNLADKYMFHMECLSQRLRMAFFDLSRSNRDSPTLVGRIGEAGYDQRMQATGRVSMDPDSDDMFTLSNYLSSAGDVDKSHEGQGEVKLTDPLRWYGLLVPQSLKNAQAQFIKVLEETVEVANMVAKLKASESVVDKLRRKLNNDSTDQEDSTSETLELDPGV